MCTSESIDKLAEDLVTRINQYRLHERNCLFYDKRTCHIREHMNISDEDLKKEITVSKQHKETPFTQETEDGSLPLISEDKQNTADWLVSNFCRICPHKDA